MKIPKVALVALLMVMAAPLQADESAGSGNWTLGPNLGFSSVSSSGGGGAVTSFGVPNGGGLFFGSLQPGLRVGHVPASGRYDVYLDTGISYASSEGESFSSVISSINMQLNFSPTVATTPYGTAGVGLVRIAAGGDSETHALFGLGFGVRKRISSGHGALRGEIRYDRLKGSDTSEGLNSFGLKVGTDLWIP